MQVDRWIANTGETHFPISKSMAKPICGKKLAEEIKQDVAKRANETRSGIPSFAPKLAVVQVNDFEQ